MIARQATSTADAMPSPYLSSALQLRAFECQAIWSACMSFARALVHSDREDKPLWVEPLTKPHIAVGLARWLANSLSHELPVLKVVALLIALDFMIRCYLLSRPLRVLV